MELATGFPGYDGRMPFENGMLPEMLVEHGYNTFCLGKWHLSPSEDNTPAGPFHRWPLGRGFERFYGFLGGETNQWYPDLTHDNGSVHAAEAPRGGLPPQRGPRRPGDQDHAGRARQRAREAVLHVLRARRGARPAPRPQGVGRPYKGRFDGGWDAYRETVFARQQELGLLPAGRRALAARSRRARVGHAVGRRAPSLRPDDGGLRRLRRRTPTTTSAASSTALEQIGELDNTLIMVISDNGASAEGGVDRLVQRDAVLQPGARELRGEPREDRRARRPESYNHYPWGWTWAGNTPFRRWKRETYRGGATDPVHPRLAGRHGGPRRGPHAVRARDRHGADRPRRARHRAAARRSAGCTQSPLEGVSFAHTFDDADAPSEHVTQYFEMFGHRSIYHDGWRAVCPWPGPNFTEAAQLGRKLGDADHARRSSTSSTARDGSSTTWPPIPTESHDVAAEHPERLRELVALVGGSGEVQGAAARRLACSRGSPTERPQTSKPRTRFVYYPGGSVGARLRGTADLQPPVLDRGRRRDHRAAAPTGVLVAQGGDAGGYTFFMDDGTAALRLQLRRARPVRAGGHATRSRQGRHALRFEFEPTGEPDFTVRQGSPGTRVSSTSMASSSPTAEFPHTAPLLFELEGLSCGYDFGAPACDDYESPFAVHRHDPQRHVRPRRRADHRRRGRAGAAHGPAVRSSRA